MRAEQRKLVVQDDGVITLDHLPVKAGERVEVVVLMQDSPPENPLRYPLRGLEPFRFDDPFSPVAIEDWDHLK